MVDHLRLGGLRSPVLMVADVAVQIDQHDQLAAQILIAGVCPGGRLPRAGE
jgi:hypothetical protein